MTAFTPKDYQQRVLDSVQTYLRACHECGNAADAFVTTIRQLWGEEHANGRSYRALQGEGFEAGMPYFCLRVPTGGGKTWLAAKSIALANRHFLRCAHSVMVWLVPSKTIREQTLTALRNKNHPLCAALHDVDGGVEVLDLEEAKNITPATLNTATVIIVATRQAFQVDDTEGRKVYESSGALMAHFENLKPEQRATLLYEENDDGSRVAPKSLVNVLRLRRPFIIVDEAHNSRTPLGFDTLARLRPSGILELTATPDMQGAHASNVLHSVSAVELKAEEMIKLPVLLEVEPRWQQCLADAIARRDALHQLAATESRAGAPYLRPIVLIQAEPHRKGVETLHVEKVRAALLENFNIPPEEIIIATGEEKGLDALAEKYPLGIADPKCPVKYVITQKALAEGWDCPSAYILASMAQLSSSTAVEQLLGRVLRQPGAKKRSNDALNQSYAFVVSPDFAATAAALRDSLVQGAGFERREAHEYVAAAATGSGQSQPELDLEGCGVVYAPVSTPLPEKPALEKLPKKIAAPLLAKIEWNAHRNMLTIHEPLADYEVQALQKVAHTPQAAEAIAQASAASRAKAAEHFRTPEEQGARFAVPQLALRKQGELQLFDDVQALDYPWALALHDAAPTAGDMARLNAGMQTSGGTIDVTDAGKLTVDFLHGLQRDLHLAWEPEHMDAVQLAAWLCRNLPQPMLVHQDKMAFVSAWLAALLRQEGWTLARACQLQFKIRDVLEARINALHKQAKESAYQRTLFDEGNAAIRPAVEPECAFDFHQRAYTPGSVYDGQFGNFSFKRHFYGRIGDFDSKEEFECACQLDMLAQQGRIKFWLRNLARQGFFLQKATDRFYPDFLCQLPQTAGGAVLAVEYKGGQLWKSAEDDRMIGGLWAELSGGRCRFVMVTGKHWEWIDEKLA